jgi:hypothetical protein
MKAGFHFNADHRSLGRSYGRQTEDAVLQSIRRRPALRIHSKAFAGDLLLTELAQDTKQKPNVEVRSFSKQKFGKVLESWVQSGPRSWKTFGDALVEATCSLSNIYVVCFDAIEDETAFHLNQRLPRKTGTLELLK